MQNLNKYQWSDIDLLNTYVYKIIGNNPQIR